MSTSYYSIREPFTSVKIDTNDKHDKITFWSRHGCAGTLIVDRGDAKLIAKMLIEYSDTPPMHSHWGGKDRGAVIEENQSGLLDEQTLISEYGEILTVAEIRARAGAKRKDGYPTELFGYEKQN